MTPQPRAPSGGQGNSRPVLVALALCCTVPMVGIVIMTSVIGIALGWAAAIAVGVVAAAVCVAAMAQHWRGGNHHDDHGAAHDHHDP